MQMLVSNLNLRLRIDYTSTADVHLSTLKKEQQNSRLHGITAWKRYHGHTMVSYKLPKTFKRTPLALLHVLKFNFYVNISMHTRI
jgi:hypothetical protein